jgi:hypothetical protein
MAGIYVMGGSAPFASRSSVKAAVGCRVLNRLNGDERLRQVGDEIRDIFEADRKSHGILADSGFFQFLWRQLPMSRGCGMSGQ